MKTTLSETMRFVGAAVVVAAVGLRMAAAEEMRGVYVLRSEKDGDLYTGFTTDRDRRFAEHNGGLSPATAPRRPLRLVFCEFYAGKSDAQRRELYFKTTAGHRALRRMLRDTLTS